MRRIHYLHWTLAFFVALVAADPSRAEFTKSGHFVCRSLEGFRQLEYSKYKLAFELMQRNECLTLEPNFVVEVVQRTRDGYLKFRLVDGPQHQTFWTSRRNIARRLQPRKENLLIGGADDALNICKKLAVESAAISRGSADLARSIIAVQDGNPPVGPRILDAVTKNDYELVVHPSEDSCGVELDVESERLVSCFVNTKAYFACTRELGGQPVRDSACFQALCTRAANFQRPSPGEEADMARARLSARAAREAQQVNSDLAAVARTVNAYMRAKADQGKGAATEGGCETLNQTLATEPRVKGYVALAVKNLQPIAPSTSERYMEALERGDFSLRAQWRDGACIGVFEPASTYRLPSMACYLVPEGVRACLASSGASNPLSFSFCLNQRACVK